MGGEFDTDEKTPSSLCDDAGNWKEDNQREVDRMVGTSRSRLTWVTLKARSFKRRATTEDWSHEEVSIRRFGCPSRHDCDCRCPKRTGACRVPGHDRPR